MRNTITISKEEFKILYSQYLNSRELIEYKKSNADYMVNVIMQKMRQNIERYNNLNKT